MTPPAEAAEPPMEEILASIRRIITEEPSSPSTETTAEPASAEPAETSAIEDRAVLPAAPAEPEPEPIAGSIETDALASSETSAKAGAAFERLANTREETARARPAYAMPEPGRSLEDVARELLAPLLKAWLDAHLPAIVESRVDEEVTRIARGRVR